MYAFLKIQSKKKLCFIQRWFRARLQQKRFIQKCSIIKIHHEVKECMNQQNKAASVIQKAVRHFLLCKKQEKINNGVTKIQVIENILILN